MPHISISTRTDMVSSVAGGVIALVTVDGPDESLEERIRGQALETVAFESVEDLLGEFDQRALSAVVVLWTQDAALPPARLVEPLAQRFAQTPVVLLCPDIERWELRAVLAAGAAGIVLHDDIETALRPCLEAVQMGQTCVPRNHWRQIEPPALSAREKQILGLVVMGYTNGQIAGQLFLAESTVKSHLSSAFGKLGVRSRNEAVSLIIDPERGLGMGILALGGEPVMQTAIATR